MRTLFQRLMIVFTAGAVLAAVTHAAPIVKGQRYHLTALGVLPGKKESTSTAINQLGQVAGTSTAEPLTEAAFLYDPVTGTMQAAGGKLTGALTRGFGVNDAGEVVGDATLGAINSTSGPPIRQAAIFRRGAVAFLGSTNKTDQHGRATDINNEGMVVGFTGPDATGNVSHAFAWSEKAGMFDLGTLGGRSARALAINDAGFVTGQSQMSGDGPTGKRHAFLGRALPSGKVGAMIDLGTLGGSSSFGMAISEKNHVAGYSLLNDTDGRTHAFLYDGEKMHDLGSLSDDVETDQSFALGVNRHGQVVGFAYRPVGRAVQQIGFVHREGVMVDLNELIGAAAKGYFIMAASAINDNGQIAATAFDYENNVFRAVLLTPVELMGTK